MSRDVFDQHFLPFENECRAFGRLKELNREHLAVKVHGYVAVEHSEIMNKKMLRAADGWDLFLLEENQDLMSFLGIRDDPAMGIVKDWVDKLEMDDWPSDEGRNEYDWFRMGPLLPRMLDNLDGLHESGIVVRDLSLNQYIRGVLVDLSFAWTIPHPYGPGRGWKPQWTFQSMAAADLHLFQYRIIDEWRIAAQIFHTHFPADERVRGITKTCSLRAYGNQVEARRLRPRVGRQRPFLPIVHYQEEGLEMVQRPRHDPGDFDPSQIREERKRGYIKGPKGRRRAKTTKRRMMGLEKRSAAVREPATG